MSRGMSDTRASWGNPRLSDSHEYALQSRRNGNVRHWTIHMMMMRLIILIMMMMMMMMMMMVLLCLQRAQSPDSPLSSSSSRLSPYGMVSFHTRGGRKSAPPTPE